MKHHPFSAIETPTYNLAKLCGQIVKPIASNYYIIKIHFSFAKEVLEIDALFLRQVLWSHPLQTETSNRNVKSLRKKFLGKHIWCYC